MTTGESSRYSDFETEDFLQDEYFQQWVRSPGKETNDFWERWLRLNPHKKETVARAVEMMGRLKFTTRYPSDMELERSLRKQLDMIAIPEQPFGRNRGKAHRIRVWLPWMAAAGFVGILLWAGAYFLSLGDRLNRCSTAAEDIRSVRLPDGSVVTLNANSELTWAKEFAGNGKREVWLKGEAYFNVRHEAQGAGSAGPFIVHARDLDIAVLGTQFNVKNGAGFTNVILNNGRVKVQFNDTTKGLRDLKPGELLRYTTSDHQVAVREVMPELYTSWKDQKMTLDKVPVSKIAGMIQDVYGDSVRFSDPREATCMISGTLRVSDEKVLLETLAFVLNINIKKEHHVIIFTSK